MKRTIGMFFFAALLSVASVPASAQDQGPRVDAPAESVREVTLLLSGYHDLAPRASFESVAGAPAIVRALAEGPHSLVRDRALAALGRYWPSGDVYLLYANIIADPATPLGTRHRVVLMYAEAFGDRAIPAIRPLLGAADLQLRVTAVQALGRIGSDEALALIDEAARTATHPVLLDAIERSSRVLR